MVEVLGAVAGDVWLSVLHNWPYLLASVVVASLVQVYVGADRLARWLRRRTWVAVLGAVVLASFTPFCSCGTTAVVLGALASSVPWAPVVAFMVSSPLTSPSEYVLSTGLFGPRFATTFFLAAIVIGIGAGTVTHVVEKAGLLRGQARMRPDIDTCTAACAETDTRTDACETGGCSAVVPAVDRRRLLARAMVANARKLALYFLGFAALGFLILELVPADVITTALGGDSFWSVPLAAFLGVPAYVSTEGSLPMVASLMDGGMGAGPALAFLVTGAGTSVGAIGGMLLIARARVVALVVGSLLIGAMLLGWAAPLWL